MIKFSDKRWDTVIKNYRLFWDNKLGRPIIPVMFYGGEAGRAKPAADFPTFANCNDLSVAPEQVIDAYDYALCRNEFYGDAFPIMKMDNFGPGVAAAFLGAELHNAADTVWFVPKKILPLSELHFEYDPDNIWLNRVKDIYAAGMKKWRGQVVMCMADLGGVLDVLSVFRPADGLLFDLYDEPDQVLRLVGELQALWLRFYTEINEILKGGRGYSDWGTIFSEKPSYMLQSDFSFMIGPDMFSRFTLNELETTAAKLTNPFYHLDGMGQLPHLDYLLKSKHIKGIQWVPGTGAPNEMDWSEIYAKISAAGKKIQGQYGLDFQFNEILKVIKRPDDLIKMTVHYPITEKQEVFAALKNYF